MKDSTLETSLDLNEIKTAYHGALKLPATSYISHSLLPNTSERVTGLFVKYVVLKKKKLLKLNPLRK